MRTKKLGDKCLVHRFRCLLINVPFTLSRCISLTPSKKTPTMSALSLPKLRTWALLEKKKKTHNHIGVTTVSWNSTCTRSSICLATYLCFFSFLLFPTATIRNIFQAPQTSNFHHVLPSLSAHQCAVSCLNPAPP